MIWSEATANWDEFRVANLFGTGTYVVPAFICLSALGLPFVRMTRFEVSAFLAGTAYFIATLTYAFVDGEVLPAYLFPPGCARRFACRVGCVEGSQAALSLSTVGVLTIFLLTCIGYPSQSGFRPKRNRSQAWDALHYANSKGRSPQV